MTQPLPGGLTEVYTWRRTLGEARRVAARLRSLGLPSGSHIALISKNCAEFVIADLAIWMAGHVSVALFPTLSSRALAALLEHAEVRLAFIGKLDDAAAVEHALPEAMPRISFSIASAGVRGEPWREILEGYEPISDSPQRRASDVALLIYTSGSTGQPKGVIHTFGGIAAAGHGLVRALGVTDGDRVLSHLPLAHAMERAGCEVTALLSGMQVFFAESPDTFVTDLKRARPTVIVSVPRLWLKLRQGVEQRFHPLRLEHLLRVPWLGRTLAARVLDGLGLDQVRVAISGSAPLSEQVIRWYRRLGLDLQEGYGMTENFAYSHVSQPGCGRVGYVGHSRDGVACRVGPGGEVLVKSPANMLGYFKQPELTRESFTGDGYLKTGDRGELDAEGRLRITGRVKEMFKTSNGKYIAPAPIENLLNAHTAIEASCVLGSGQRAPCALVTLVNGAEESAARLVRKLAAVRAEVNAQLARDQQLEFLVVSRRPWTIESGELTPSLKIRRGVIESAAEQHLASWYGRGAGVILEQ